MWKSGFKNYSMSLTTEQFIFQLASRFLPELKLTEHNLYLYGRQKGWLEDEDERFKSELLNKRNAARIIHNFMLKELNIPDSLNIDKAKELLDLYSCRTCANHIAQVYVKDIMTAEEYEYNGTTGLIFNMLKLVSYDEAVEIIGRIKPI